MKPITDDAVIPTDVDAVEGEAMVVYTQYFNR